MGQRALWTANVQYLTKSLVVAQNKDLALFRRQTYCNQSQVLSVVQAI